MNFLLFFISFVFSSIFYIFYVLGIQTDTSSVAESSLDPGASFIGLSGNLLIEAGVFLIIAFFFLFYFSRFKLFKSEKLSRLKTAKIQGRNVSYSVLFQGFLRKYLYYIGFIFFYISIFFILKSLGVSDFAYLILLLNVVILILFFITHKAEIFRDFIKINTILFSLYYIFSYSLLFITGIDSVILIDIINTCFLFALFLIHFYSDFQVLGRKESDSVLVLYFFLYSFIVACFYGIQLFQFVGVDFIYGFIFIGLAFHILIFYFVQKLSFFQAAKYVLRGISFLCLYVAMLFSLLLLISIRENFLLIHIFVGLCLVYGIVFNYWIHILFQNYISLFFSVSSFCFILFYMLFSFNIGDFVRGQLILSFTLALLFILGSYIYKYPYSLDYYFLHICAYLVSFLGISYFFWEKGFSMLSFGVILLLSSIIAFLSYFQLRSIKKHEN